MYTLPKALAPTEHRNGVKSGDNYALWNTPNLTAEQFFGLSSIDRLVYLAILGSLAPSTHNTQPWAFKPDPEKNLLYVYLDRDRVLPASDVNGRQACVSAGCAIGSVVLAAESYGLTPKIDIFVPTHNEVKPYQNSQSRERYVPIATVVFPKNHSNTDTHQTREAIFTRRMDRGEFISNKSIPQNIIEQIKAYCSKQKIGLTLFERGRLFGGIINLLSEAQYTADNHVANTPAFSRELGDWFLENGTSAHIGMPGDTFKQDDSSAKEISDQLSGKKPLKAMSIFAFANAGRLGIQSSPLMGVLTVSKDTPENWIRSGIALGNMATYFESQGIRIAIHAGLAEVAEMALDSLPTNFFKKKSPTILFRAGYSEEPLKPHSPRLPITEVLLA